MIVSNKDLANLGFFLASQSNLFLPLIRLGYLAGKQWNSYLVESVLNVNIGMVQLLLLP